MESRHLYGLLVAVLAVGALAFRLADLDRRPMHGDEANQAHRTGVLFERGTYQYDPKEHHGPSLYYLTLPVLWLSGASSFAETSEAHYRIVPVLFGVGLIVLLPLVASGLGRSATIWAALFTALSPAMVFYSRYYIQETLLVFFTFAALASAWRYLQQPRLHWALLAGASLGMMHASKETSVLAYGAMAVALALARFWRREEKPAPLFGHVPVWWHLIGAATSALVVSVLFFSSFLTHPMGPIDSVRAYFTYLDRAAFGLSSVHGIHLHRHPWHFFLKLLLYTKRMAGPWWSEGLIVGLACLGAGAALRRGPAGEGSPGFLRFIALYTMTLTVIYSLIPYKTPWCLLGFFHGMILMAGYGATSLVQVARHPAAKGIMYVLLLAATGQLAMQSWRANFVYDADPRNPYVYAHTSPALVGLAQRIEDLAQLHPLAYGMPVYIIEPQGDYWPLPWYLRRLQRVGYWSEVPEPPDAPVIIVSPDIQERLQTRLSHEYHVEYSALRPGVLRLVYIREDVWQSFLKKGSHGGTVGSIEKVLQGGGAPG